MYMLRIGVIGDLAVAKKDLSMDVLQCPVIGITGMLTAKLS